MARRPRHRLLSRLSLTVWAVALSLLVAYTAGAHLLTLPTPAEQDPRLISGAKSLPGSFGWRAVHFLYDGCRCSARVFNHLIERGAAVGADVHETIVLVRDGEPSAETDALIVKARGARFHVEVETAAGVEARFGTVSAPLLVVVAPDGTPRYVGGYTTRKQGPFIADASIIRRVRDGEHVAALPLFGCAVSRDLQKKVDPLRLR